ncbi:MAG: ATP synthase F1 subunit delta [Candidatus Eremiobacteraeota bacterium]|nr:ATP synthase F1 subunit delta [Candidatus Eremiobacteraeota bacterium]MBV8280757.1 ATP synthase F1 subunit delta [Candidatus Eremiobacteraeota bacterium]
MPKVAVARRYSAALFALAAEAGAGEQTVSQLDAFVAALDRDPELSQFYESPVIDRARKEQMLQTALAGASELVRNFIVLLVRKRRESIVRLVAHQMHELLDAHEGRARAMIETPSPLPPAELAALARRLSAVYHRSIEPQVKVEPELLGGIVVQVGDRYIDASVSGKLEGLRRHLLASADTWPAASSNGHAGDSR